ncbi:G-type lectin S-receptor-like serine/threonine-protein kinase At1g11330 isoform X1 [Carica papaya]|uniref:G-type lectin S-receptor-like serine/threonine-protein kinase At1g11330 isoform X1 n=1 Tax=Carica papaya TaxID=3649 RepID=UPI000B8CA0FD|nr:G-type lectin S-receptor-like serine/threonine-protein kinase At1g11330 isoform X1 [Carica papaya]
MKISDDGNLVILTGKNEILWSSNISNPVKNSCAQLLDTGNLVLKDDSSGVTLWESFQHPSNTVTSKMRLSTNPRTGKTVKISSWKSPDPSDGMFSAGIDVVSAPEFFIWNGSRPFWRSGPWNGLIFTEVTDISSSYGNGFKLVDEEGTFYLSYTFSNTSLVTKFVLSSEGNLVQTFWEERKNNWEHVWMVPSTECELYGKCGEFGYCDKERICSCLKGFEPKNPEEWKRGNWTGGCVRKKSLQCNRNNGGKASQEDGFDKLANVKVPDFVQWSFRLEDECKDYCFSNCSCVAYAYNSGIGCMLWTGTLIDVQILLSDGIDLHIRLHYSELDKKEDSGALIITAAILGTVAISICTFFLRRWMVKHRGGSTKLLSIDLLGHNKNQIRVQELPLFNFEILAAATNNFNPSNKLGQGGFGPVYKGKLQDGQEVAVKRLSSNSGQGLEEFRNEVVVISKLQHRNLVRLFGCCVEGEENILVYEYMPNRSLDAILFDPIERKCLNWRKRLNIIEGIGRGLLYLHRDSRLRIIHRDLKASNILLDEELNPKISDFGMARIFGGKEDRANTRRVVGTYGYMSPEYAMEGQFSEKSDVFSFGVLLLEIISGRRNSSFYSDKQFLNLLSYAWKLWKEENIVEFIDAVMFEPRFKEEMLRCVHVGLLCVQEFAKDRPSVSTVISMLKSEIVDLPNPKQPAFTERQILNNTNSSPMNSTNKITITVLEGR